MDNSEIEIVEETKEQYIYVIMACLKSPKVLQTLITKYFKYEANLKCDKPVNELLNYVEESNDIVISDFGRLKNFERSGIAAYISNKRIGKLSTRRMVSLGEEIISLRFRLDLMIVKGKSIWLDRIIS